MSQVKSFLFDRPMSLINLLKNKKRITAELQLQSNPLDWYFSKEAIDRFNSLDTPADKIKFLFNYLFNIVDKRTKQGYRVHYVGVYKLSLIMVRSMVDSNLKFGGYPNVLDESKNPLIKFIKTTPIPDDFKNFPTFGVKMLKALHQNKKSCIDELTTYTEECTQMYKIERDIISMFSISYTDDSTIRFAPYSYSFPSLSNTSNADEELDEYEDEDLEDNET